jgi:hypothetical protein
MEICNHDEPRLRRNATANLSRIYGPAIFFDAPEAFHFRFQIMGDIENWTVCGVLD